MIGRGKVPFLLWILGCDRRSMTAMGQKAGLVTSMSRLLHPQNGDIRRRLAQIAPYKS
jgi:hypothetical protein